MSTWVIIPVKPLRLAKSRLAEVLSPEQRQRFAESMFRHVLEVVRQVPLVTGALVISRDQRALTIARDYGAKTVQESGAPELNTALMRATQIIASWRSDAVLILPADLPMISTDDISGIIKLGQHYERAVTIATDRNKDGTNALYVRPPGLIQYAYGPGSYQRHAVLARDAGAEVNVYESENLLQDIDLPEDIANFYRILHRREHDMSLSLSDAFDAIQAKLEQR
ncbi:MAG: 2-phospho-L-lactate guanylyltransferase [Anaerolineae bacterium]|jgi:2-phospho-L-lactate guanylyltransferase|nr:2-phospho-L-lactate guanylyltransferase [Anaerolineae bacterium]